MTDPNPIIIEAPLPERKTEIMAGERDGTDRFHAIVDSSMASLAQSGTIAQNNFITTSKAQDLDYLEGKRLVSLDEAVGIREVASKVTPGGPSPA